MERSSSRAPKASERYTNRAGGHRWSDLDRAEAGTRSGPAYAAGIMPRSRFSILIYRITGPAAIASGARVHWAVGRGWRFVLTQVSETPARREAVMSFSVESLAHATPLECRDCRFQKTIMISAAMRAAVPLALIAHHEKTAQRGWSAAGSLYPDAARRGRRTRRQA